MVSPRVCFIINAVGKTSVPADIATALVKYTDVKVDVLAWFSAEDFEGSHRINVMCLDAPDTRIGTDRATIARATRILHDYDIIQAHHNHSGSFAKVIARYLGIPSISREGNMRVGFSRKGLFANGLTNPLADRIVCNSCAVYDSFRWWETLLLPESKIVFIPNGVDFERIAAGKRLSWNPREEINAGEETVLISTVGSLTKQKNQRTLIRAMDNVVSQTDQHVELCIAGTGPLESDLRELTNKFTIQDSVHFLGQLERLAVYKLLSQTDIYAMPSRWEGFSAAAVEALATNNAAVFSDIQPFTDPYSGSARFHPICDHGALADHLIELIKNPSKRHELAQSGRQLVKQNYQMKKIARMYEDLYFEIVDG